MSEPSISVMAFPATQPKTPRKALIVFGLVFIEVIFAGWNVLAKDLMRGGVNAMTFLAYRLLCASVVLLLYAYVVIRYVDRAPHVSILSVQRQHMPLLLLLGALAAAALLLFLLALLFLPATTASIYVPMMPVMTALLGRAWGMEKLTSEKLMGVLLCAAGALAVTVGGEKEEGPLPGGPSERSGWGGLLGNLLMVASMFSFAWRMLAMKPLLKIYAPVLVNAWIHSVAAVLSVAIVCVFAVFGFLGLSSRDFLLVDGSTLFALAYSSILATGLCYTVITWATKYESATVVTSYTGLNPVFTALLAHLTRGVDIDIFQVSGATLAIFGLLIATRGEDGQRKDDMIRILPSPRMDSKIPL